ncbi:hypothetical protein KAR91_44890 [Candidatus Pacearchaeota archaeon]|nr:hypothetical protein [Candidatus Pacearchaeota archaeon]
MKQWFKVKSKGDTQRKVLVFCGDCENLKHIRGDCGYPIYGCNSNPIPQRNAIYMWDQCADCEVKNKNNDCLEFTPKQTEKENIKMFSCECNWFKYCGEMIEISDEDAEKIKSAVITRTQRLIVIHNDCKNGPEKTDTLINRREKYSLFQYKGE